MLLALICLPLLLSLLVNVGFLGFRLHKVVSFVIPLCTIFLSFNIATNTEIVSNFLGMKFEPIARSFMIFLNIMWFITTVYSIGYKQQKSYNPKQFSKITSLIGLSVFWTQIIALAVNSIVVLFCYEMLTITTFFLVNFDKTKESYAGAKKYFTILMASSIGMLVPFIIILNVSVGNSAYAKFITENYQSFILALLVFGASKNAIFPLSSWLKAAMVAPIPVSSLLHAVAVVNTGIIIVLKFYVYAIKFAMPYDVLGSIIKVATIITIFLPAFQAFRSHDIKSILAYSTISQLGVIMFAMFAMPKDARLVEIIICQLFAHGIAKIILFFIAGEFYAYRKTYDINSYGNMIVENPFIVVAFILAALSIAGLPPFIGFYTKAAMVFVTTSYIDQSIIIGSSLFTLLYFSKVFVRITANSDVYINNNSKKPMTFTLIAIFFALTMLILSSQFRNEILVFLWNR